MNKAKWTATDLPLEFLALKLTEEVGEVAKEITDALVIEEGEYIGHNDPNTERILTELEHVEFLVKTLRSRIVNSS